MTEKRDAGLLIVLEGLDGAGTTTQARLLVEGLRAAARPAHGTREPSDGPIGRLLREMLVGRHAIPDQAIDQSTFGLLFAADRMDHLQREVDPALAEGTVVVSDRWYHSSLAYQGTGAERNWILALNSRARVPDLTIFLCVEAGIAAQRRVAAGRAQELFEDLEMQRKVEEGYWDTLDRLRARGDPIHVLDGHQSVEDIQAEIWRVVHSLLARSKE